VSAVIARWPVMISLMREAGMPIALARRYWLMPRGSRNSPSQPGLLFVAYI
jgi:hypothetical protein